MTATAIVDRQLQSLEQTLNLAARRNKERIPVDAGHCLAQLVEPRESAWEKVAPGVAVNTYQNGAYWHTATGWLLNALYRHEPVMARKQLAAMVAHLREHDFRKGDAVGAPWECFGRDGAARQNPVYMASVAVPLSVVKKIEGLK